jgi:hypothetical protein
MVRPQGFEPIATQPVNFTATDLQSADREGSHVM